MPDVVRVQDAERVDVPDFTAIAGTPLAYARQFGASVLHQPGLTVDNVSRYAASILTGFKPRVDGVATNRNLRVDRGVAVLSMRESGTVYHGVPSSEGDAQKIIVLPATAGTYGVWIRFEMVEAGFGNRVFWDPVAGAEFSQSIPTRRIAGWGLAVGTIGFPANPPNGGAEWVKIGEATVDGGGSLSVTAQRHLMFEGRENSGPFGSAWGDGNDRSADRDAYGIKDVSMLAQATLKKIEELQSGSARWWTVPVEPLDQKVSRNGDTSMLGNYKFNGGGNTVEFDTIVQVDGILHANAGIRNATPQDIGTSAARFARLYLNTGVDIDNGTTDSAEYNAGNVVVGSTGFAGIFAHEYGDATKFAHLYYDVSGVETHLRSSASIFLRPNGVGSSVAPAKLTATTIEPGTTNTISIGTASKRYAEVITEDLLVYDRLNVNVGGKVLGHFIPFSPTTYDLGEPASGYFRDGYISSVYTSNIRDTSGGAGDVTFHGAALKPDSTGKNLGATGARWDVFAAAIDASGAVDVGGALTVTGDANFDGNVVLDTENGSVAEGTGVSGTPGIFGFKIYGSVAGQSTVEIEADDADSMFIRFNGDNADNATAPISTADPSVATVATESIRVHLSGLGDRWIHVYSSRL